MARNTILVGVAVAFLFPAWLMPGTVFAQRLVEKYAAAVNDRVILLSDVLAQMRPLEARLRARYQGEELREKLESLYQESLNAVVDRALILEEFETLEIEIPERAIDDQMQVIIRERFNNDRSEMFEALAEEQMTLERWRLKLMEQLVIGLMRRDHVFENITLSPNAASDLYEERRESYFSPSQDKLRMITIAKGKTNEDLVKQVEKIKNARQRVKRGEAFDGVARELSEGTKADKGGDWGWRNPAELREELAEAIKDLPVGQVSDIIDAGEKYYLVLVEDRKEENQIPLEDVREELEKELREREGERIHEDL